MSFVRHANDALYQVTAHHQRNAPVPPLDPAVAALFQQIQAHPHAWLAATAGGLLLSSIALAVRWK